MMIRRVFTLAVVGTLTGCAVEEGAPPSDPKGDQGDGTTVAVDTDDVAFTSLNTYISKCQGEKQGAFKGGN